MIVDPGETPTALLILIPGIPFVDLVDFGCVDTPRAQGDDFDFSFVIDANECLDIEPASTVETMVDDDYFPVAGFLWVAIEDGQPVEFECLDVQGEVSTGGDIDAVIEFLTDPLVLGGITGTMSDAGTMDDFVASMSSMSSIGSERTELFDVSQVGALLLADEAGPLDDLNPNADAVWTVEMEFSPCSGGGRLPGLDIDHYRGRAEQGVLPNTD